MIGIIDYGMGNLASVHNAFNELNIESMISGEPEVLSKCDKLVLPGVGAFEDCMGNIHRRGLYDAVNDIVLGKKKPLLGICLGMQMLFDESEEKGITRGFGFLKGRVVEMKTDLPVPEIGWNELVFTENRPKDLILSAHPYVYYVHSYSASEYNAEDLAAYSQYGDIRVPGIAIHDNVIGCQFHPEKSSADGLKILKWFEEKFI